MYIYILYIVYMLYIYIVYIYIFFIHYDFYCLYFDIFIFCFSQVSLQGLLFDMFHMKVC